MQTNVNGASVLGEVGLSGDLHLLQHLLPQSSERCNRPIIQRIIRKPVGTVQLDIVSAKGKEMSVLERSMVQFIPPKLKSSLWAFVIVRLPLLKKEKRNQCLHTTLETRNTVSAKHDATHFQ